MLRRRADGAAPVIRIPCGAGRHRVAVRTDGGLDALDHDGGELVLAALGAAAGDGCPAVLAAWRAGLVTELPRALRPAATARWAAAGVVDWWEQRTWSRALVAGVAPHPAAALTAAGARVPGAEVALWWAALDEPPTPESVRALRRAGVTDGGDALWWAQALGRRPTPDDVRRLRAEGLADGAEAVAWSDACGRLPTPPEREALRAAGVADGHDAAAWAGALGREPAAAEVAGARAMGVHDGWDAAAWVQALGRLPTAAEVAAHGDGTSAWAVVGGSDP